MSLHASTMHSYISNGHAANYAATTELKASSSTPSEKVSSNKKRLSRPERKALERERKAKQNNNGNEKVKFKSRNGRRGHNFSANNPKLIQKDDKNESRYGLHSTIITELTSKSTTEEVMRAIKRAQNLHDVHDIRNIERFLLEEVDATFAYGYRGSLLARLAVAALHMSNTDLARKAIKVRRLEHRPSMLPLESAAIVRGLLRVHCVDDALTILEDELSLPLEGVPLDTEESREKLKHRASAICSIISRHFFEGEPYMGVKACTMLANMGPIVRSSGLKAKDLNMPWARLIKGASQCESQRRAGELKLSDDDSETELPVNLVYSVLNAMTTFPSDNNDAVYEGLSNALVRRTCFLTGAVNIKTMPKADRGEVAFIGRSNVGKSSLVNMVTNRKSLAYTSRQPGKTKQFNYFAVNDKPELLREIKYGDEVSGERDLDSFYIVDLPGFGFAKVSQKQREQWADLMAEYMNTRKTLRVLFHLIDARHGPLPEDINIMQKVGESLPKRVSYVIILTKADKNVRKKANSTGRVAKDVMTVLREEMKKAKVGNTPVLLTSSATKLGRDDMWRYMRKAAEF